MTLRWEEGAEGVFTLSADRRVSELEAKLAAKDAALKEKEAELAKKQAALAEKDAELAAMQHGNCVAASIGVTGNRPPYTALMRFGLPTARPRRKEAARELAAMQRELTELSALALREQRRRRIHQRRVVRAPRGAGVQH